MLLTKQRIAAIRKEMRANPIPNLKLLEISVESTGRLILTLSNNSTDHLYIINIYTVINKYNITSISRRSGNVKPATIAYALHIAENIERATGYVCECIYDDWARYCAGEEVDHNE